MIREDWKTARMAFCMLGKSGEDVHARDDVEDEEDVEDVDEGLVVRLGRMPRLIVATG
jgi:hypothetical protein